MRETAPILLAACLLSPLGGAAAAESAADRGIAGDFQDALGLFNEKLDGDAPLAGRAVPAFQPSAGEITREDRQKKEEEIRGLLYGREWEKGQALILLHLENLGVSPVDLWYGCHFVLRDGGTYYSEWKELGSKSRVSSHY